MKIDKGPNRSVRNRGRSKRLVTLSVAAALAVSVVAPGLTGSAGASVRSADPGLTKDEIVIGRPTILTGTSAQLAANAVLATNAYFAEVNETEGGINGRKVRSQIEDAGSNDPAGALAAVTKLKDNSFVILASDGTIFGPLAQRFKLPLFVGFGTEEEARRNKYEFPVTTLSTYQAKHQLPDFLINELDAKGKKIAIVFTAAGYLVEAKDAFVKAAKKKGLDIVIEQPLDNLPPQCAQEVSNVQAAKADIVVPFFLTAGICFFRTAGQQGFKTVYSSVVSTFLTDVFVTLAGPGTMDGSLSLNGFPVFDSKCAADFQALMRKRLPGNTAVLTDQIAFQTYLAVRNAVMRMQEAGKFTTREGMIKKIANGKPFDDGCLPPTTFGPGNKRTGATTANVSKIENSKILTDVAEYKKKF